MSVMKTPTECLLYMTECTLFTVESMAMKRKRPVHEFQRQIEIAQWGINKCLEFDAGATRERFRNLIQHDWNVAKWAEKYYP